MEDGLDAIDEGNVAEDSVGAASEHVFPEASKASDDNLSSTTPPVVGDGDADVGPALAGDSSGAYDAAITAIATAVEYAGSFRSASVGGEASVPDRGADLDAPGEASSDLPVGAGEGDGSIRDSLSSAAEGLDGPGSDVGGDAREGRASAPTAVTEGGSEGEAQLGVSPGDADPPDLRASGVSSVTTAEEQPPEGADPGGEPIDPAASRSASGAITPAEASRTDGGASDGGFVEADGGSGAGPDGPGPAREGRADSAANIAETDDTEAGPGVGLGADEAAERSSGPPPPLEAGAGDGDGGAGAGSAGEAAGSSSLDGGADRDGAGTAGDGNVSTGPSASSLGVDNGGGGGDSAMMGSSDHGAGDIKGADADATAATPPTVVRPRSAASDADDLPPGRGGGRRSSYVSPQYDEFERSSSTSSSDSRRAAAAMAATTAGTSSAAASAAPSAAPSAGPSAAPSMSRRSGASVSSERPPTGGSLSSRPNSEARRSSAVGSPAASRPDSAGQPRRTSETAVAAQNGGGDGAAAAAAPEEAAEPSSSRRPSVAASSGCASSARQGSVSYAWRGSSASGDGAAAASRPGSAEDVATPRASGISRNASFASEASSITRRVSMTAAVQPDDGGGGGLAVAMVSAPPPKSLPPLGSSQPDAASSSVYGTTERSSIAPSLYSSAGGGGGGAGELRQPSSQGAASASGSPNPLPPLPTSASLSGLLGAAERSKPRSIASAPAGDSRSASGGAAGSASGGAGAPAGRPPPPVHLFPTHVQPKGPLDECTTQAASQHVRTVWSTSNICGIRSLPNALSPDFRDRLYEELVQAAHRDRAFTAPSHKPQLSYGLEGGPLGMPLSVGQKQVARINPLAGMFTQYEYLPSEYDRVKLTGKFDRLKHKLAQTSPSEFVVRAPPATLHGAPAFSEFTYACDPADSLPASMHADAHLNRSKVVAGPFYPSGRVQTARVLKGRLDECMMRLCKQLSDDWPNSFLQVFEDRNGSVVASFHKSSAVSEGDLSSYMNTLAKRNHVVATYQLTKDATRWGLVDEASGEVFYVMWPPWVRHRYLGPHTAPPASEVPSGRPGTRGSNSSDEEEEGAAGAGEDVAAGQGQGQGTDAGDGTGLGYPNQPLDAFATLAAQRRTGVY